MHKKKRPYAICISTFLSVILLFSACDGIKITELNERLIIEAIGIDYGENGDYAVTVQALDSEATGSEQDDASAQPTKTFVFSGASVGEALNGISVHTGKTPLYSQARVIIIGNEVAKRSIGEALDFFLREYTTRTDILTAVAEKSAKETVNASFGENAIGAQVIENALNSGEYTGNAVAVPLYKFINLLIDEKSGAFCPVIGVRKEELSDDARIEVTGTALFYGNTFRSVLNTEETRGLLFLTDRISSADLPLKSEDGIFTLRIVSSKTKTEPPKDGGNKFAIRITTECDITEFESPDFSMLTSAAVERARRASEEKIKEAAERALTSAYFTNGCDVCRFERRFWLSQPNRYRQLTDGGADLRKGFSAEITASVKIRRTGKETLYG